MLKLLLRLIIVLMLCWMAGMAAATAVGEQMCCRVVAFTALRGTVYDVYTLDMALGRAFNLTEQPALPNRAGDYLAGWSPDGRWLAFTSERGPTTGLYVMNSFGRQVRRMPDDCISEARWSPAGDYFLCIPPPVTAQDFPDAYVIAAASGAVQRLNQTPGKGTRFAAWSPEGRRVVFDESDAAGISLRLLNVHNSYREEIARMTVLSGLAWLPDERIAYIGQCNGNTSAVILTLDSSQTVCYDLVPTIRLRATWSPDGHWLAYQALCYQRERAAVLNLQTGAMTCLMEGGAVTSNFAWSPEGRWLAWGTHSPADYLTKVWLYDTVTGSLRLLFSSKYYEGAVGMRWSPDGKYLSFAVLVWTGGSDGVFVVDIASGAVGEMLPDNFLEISPFAWQP